MSSSIEEQIPDITTMLRDRRFRPDRIEDLWRQTPSHSTVHLQAQSMELWVTNEEISNLLNDPERLGQMVAEFTSDIFWVGMYCYNHNEQLGAMNSIFVNPNCVGCNTPYDAGGCQHQNSPNRIPMLDPEVNQRVHSTVVMLSVINYLLVQDHLNNTNQLALLLCVKQEDGCSPNWRLNTGRKVPPIVPILGLLDNCSHAFPKVSQNAAGMLSLLICTDPSAAFSCLDGLAFVESTYKYLGEVFRLVHNAECVVEEHFGIVAFLNILPALYHFGMWKEAQSSRKFNTLAVSFTSLILNIAHNATWKVRESEMDTADVDAISDPPRDLKHMPEMLAACVFWESLLLVKDDDQLSSSSSNQILSRDWRIKLLHDSPRTFAVVAGIEVLGWWSSKGIDLTRGKINVTRGPDGGISECLDEYMPRIRLLLRGSSQKEVLSPYIERIAAAIIGNKKAKVPLPGSSLLYGPFYYDSRRCGLCHKTEREVGHKLLSCAGGCQGLEQYCCKEHQKKDWKKHKFWCKKNATYTQYGGR